MTTNVTWLLGTAVLEAMSWRGNIDIHRVVTSGLSINLNIDRAMA